MMAQKWSLFFAFLFLVLPFHNVEAFTTNVPRMVQLKATATTTIANTQLYSEPSDVSTWDESVDELKEDLVRACSRDAKPTKEEITRVVEELEEKAEAAGIGMASSSSGLLSGEWELLYSPEDVTRSSPFFWAFRQAFPGQSDQIFGITDSIPAPIKEVGPAYQTIDMKAKTFVSRVKVATLGGMTTSIMTTRGTIVGEVGLDGIRIKIDTTKPEDSTIVKTVFGPLGSVVNDNLPPFPSGDALERVMPGSSEVVMRTTFCDEGIRVSRNNANLNDIYVWRRSDFPGFATM